MNVLFHYRTNYMTSYYIIYDIDCEYERHQASVLFDSIFINTLHYKKCINCNYYILILNIQLIGIRSIVLVVSKDFIVKGILFEYDIVSQEFNI